MRVWGGHGLAMLAAIGCVATSAPLHAQAAERRILFDQPQQSLAAALRAYAKTTSQQIVFDEDGLRGRSAPSLRGRMTAAEALERLLRGTGLVARRGRTGILIIMGEAPKDGPQASLARSFEPEDIIVTARKRQERAIDVPIALTSTSGRESERQGVAAVQEVLERSPGVGVYDLGNGTTKITIRGISTSLGANENGYYLDDLPFTGVTVPISPDVRAWDLDRVEVLRGPQGTLFGEGSMGGTVRILTRGADLDDWEARAALVVSDTRDGGTNVGVKGALNAPLIPGILAVRLAGTHERFDGWIDNSDTGAANVNDQRYDTLRAKLRFDPIDGLAIMGSYWRSRAEFPGGGGSARDDGEQSRSNLQSNSIRYDLYGAAARYDMSSAELFIGYSRNVFSLPLDGSFLGGTLNTRIDIIVDSLELRAASRGMGRLQWTIGAYLRNALRSDSFDFALFDIDNAGRTRSSARALFGEATYAFPGTSIDLTAGLRYFQDRLRGSEINAGVVTIQPDGDYRSLNPRFAVAWHPKPDTTLYASAAKGFRSGQLQPTTSVVLGAKFGVALPSVLAQDSIWSYEIGAKAELFGRRLTLEAAAFYSDWKNVTVRIPIATTGFNGLINSRGTRSRGIEFSLLARPVRGLSLTVAGAYIDAAYAAGVAGTGIVQGAAVEDVATFTANVSTDYRRALGENLTGFARVAWQHSSPRRNVSFPIYRPGDAIDRVDAQLGVEFADVSVALFVNNLTGDDGAISYRTVQPTLSGIDDTTAYRWRPRTVGLQANFALTTR